MSAYYLVSAKTFPLSFTHLGSTNLAIMGIEYFLIIAESFIAIITTSNCFFK